MHGRYYGKYRAICRDNNDPAMVGRIRAEVPAVLGVGEESWTVWAWPSLPPGHFDVPSEGTGVWVEFEAGDPNSPLWSGVWWKGDGETTEAPLQAVHPALTDMDGTVVDWDKTDHVSPKNPVDDFEHQQYPGHNHSSGFYSPHRRLWVSATGHSLEWNDHPGVQGAARLSDRFGRLVEFLATGVTRLRSAFYGVESAEWKDLNGAVVEAAHSLTLQDKGKDTTEQFAELKDLAGATLRLTSTPGQEAATLADFWGQHVRINTVKGSEYVELLDKAGQTVRLDVATGKVTVADKNQNSIVLEAGKITITGSGLVTVNGSDKVVVNATDVFIGGEGGAQELATKKFVQLQYNTHTHISSAPGSPTSPPMAPSPLAPGNDITKNQKSL